MSAPTSNSNDTKNADLWRFIDSVLLPSVAHEEETRERIEYSISMGNFGSDFHQSYKSIPAR